MPPLHLRSAVEALLFSSDQPLSLALIADALESEADAVATALHELGEDYKRRESGVELREMAGGWIVTTTAEQHEWVARMLRGKRKMRLSRAALETLAIIAYKQPVTKSEIEAIRGVDSSGTLATLLERSLVTIKGRSTVVGRPLLYGSTPDFLNYVGLKDLTELPRPEELRALVAAREPEQMEMLEADVDGMPLGGVETRGEAGDTAGEPAGEPVSKTLLVSGDIAEASDAGDDDDAGDDEYADDEFEDDEDDDADEDEDAGEDAGEDDEPGRRKRPAPSVSRRPAR